MAIHSEMPDEAVVAAIAKVRETWLDAVRVADVERLVDMVTDDIVVMHGTGRCLRGKDELSADFCEALKRFRSISVPRCRDISKSLLQIENRAL